MSQAAEMISKLRACSFMKFEACRCCFANRSGWLSSAHEVEELVHHQVGAALSGRLSVGMISSSRDDGGNGESGSSRMARISPVPSSFGIRVSVITTSGSSSARPKPSSPLLATKTACSVARSCLVK